jgi:peptide/nickel transport system substrate-binding protein
VQRHEAGHEEQFMSESTSHRADAVFNRPVNRRDLMTMTIGGVAAIGLGIGAASGAVAQDAPVRGGTIRGAVVGPVTSLDPYSSLLGSGDGMSYQALYNSLVEVSLAGEVTPELASEWTLSDDQLTYTFTLVEGVTFHDGTALDAEAIKWNLERYKAEGSTHTAADRLRVIETIEATDATTLTITLSSPNAPFLPMLSGCPIVSPAAVEELGEDFQLQGVGSGPFRFESWEPGSAATFVRNESYWEVAPDGEPFPYLDSLVVDGVPDDSVRMLNLRSGEFQLNERLNPLDFSTIGTVEGVELVETTLATSYLVAMNVTKAPFDNPVLRQAVQSAVDRAAVIDNISFGTGYTSSFAFPQGSWFFIEEPAPVFDTEAAKATLAEAGYPDGIDITLSIINRPVDNQISQIVKAQLDEVGIRTTIEVLERTTWVDLWSARGGEMGILQRGAGGIDPDEQSAFFSPTNIANFAGYESPEILELIDQSNQTVDQEARLDFWKQIVEIMIADAAYVFMGCVPAPGAKRVEVQELEIVQSSTWKLVGTTVSQ